LHEVVNPFVRIWNALFFLCLENGHPRMKIVITQRIDAFPMGLYGIYGSHSPESCPLNNVEIRSLVIKMAEQLDKVLSKNNVKMLQQYHSGLEHTFVWIVDAQDAHSIEKFMIESGWIKFNALKIVPLTEYKNVIEGCKHLGIA
jgi:uncharacterized protein with GYD domain